MKNQKMLHAIGQIDDDLIEDARIQASTKKRPVYTMLAFRRAVAIAACFILIIGFTLSLPILFKPNNEAPGFVPNGPGVIGPVDPDTLLPPSVQEDGQHISINGIDRLSYYAAIRVIAEAQKTTNQSMTGGSYGITLLTSSGTDKKEVQTVPETTYPDETQGPPVTPNPPTPPDSEEDIYYYELDPDQPFYFNKVSMFQIELTDENGFLASKLGLGIVDVVISEDCIWGDSLVTFRNGEKFFSCLHNSWHLDQKNGGWQWEFSTHKYVEGFNIVKNFEQENHAFYIDMNVEGQAIEFDCQGTQNGGYHADQNVKVVSATVISTGGGSFTVSELEGYFNTEKFQEDPTPPTQLNTNLEF